MREINECFAVTNKGGCAILDKDQCDYKTCTFYKTELEKLESEYKAKKRCESLGIKYIAPKEIKILKKR